MKEGIFLKGKLTGYTKGSRTPNKEIPGQAFYSDKIVIISNKHITVEIKPNGEILIAKHKQLE